MKQQEIEKLQKDIDEANERIEVLGDNDHLVKEPIILNVLGFDYEPVEFSFENNSIYLKCFQFKKGYKTTVQLEVEKSFFKEYLNKLRHQCIETHTLTFEEAEPEEYREAKVAEEAMKSPNFKEIFEYSEDPPEYQNEYTKNWRRAHDNQELWWQQGEE